MVRDIVANDAATGFDSRRPLQFAPADGPVDGLLSRRCWFESNSGRHTRADGNGGDLLSRQTVSSSLTAGAAKLMGISIPGQFKPDRFPVRVRGLAPVRGSDGNEQTWLA